MSIPAYWEEAKAILSDADPVLGKIIARYHGEVLRGKGDAFLTLARSIVGQQISVKAADAVWGRLEAACGSQTLEAFIAFSDEDILRACGLSQRKAMYLSGLVEFFRTENIDAGFWDAMEDTEVIEHLTQIKGIGRWSAEMFLIFHLLRPDVFPLDDIGLQKAIALHYHEGKRMEKERLGDVGGLWKPYRSVATWYLWRSLDPVPVAY